MIKLLGVAILSLGLIGCGAGAERSANTDPEPFPGAGKWAYVQLSCVYELNQQIDNGRVVVTPKDIHGVGFANAVAFSGIVDGKYVLLTKAQNEFLKECTKKAPRVWLDGESSDDPDLNFKNTPKH